MEAVSQNEPSEKDLFKNLTYQELITKLPSYYKINISPRNELSVTTPIKNTVSIGLILSTLPFALLFGGIGFVAVLDGACFAIIHLMIGICAAAAFIYMFFGQVEIKLDKQVFIQNVKLFFFNVLTKKIPVSEISQFYCKEVIAYREGGDDSPNSGTPVYKYHLFVEYRTEKLSIMSEQNPDPIWALEVLFERIFRIEDKVVRGEYGIDKKLKNRERGSKNNLEGNKPRKTQKDKSMDENAPLITKKTDRLV